MSGDNYLIRSLREDEIEAWLDHTAACFSAKGTPRSHFANHYHKDPSRRPEAIFVALPASEGEWDAEDCGVGEGGSNIAASLRVFERCIYFRGEPVQCGGIGEVCTKPQHRRKGLCRRLLHHAGEAMALWNYELSALHSSQMTEVYKSCGYVSVPLVTCIYNIDKRMWDSAEAARAKAGLNSTAERIQHADAKPSEEMIRMHESYTSMFNGATQRQDPSYWTDYLSTNTSAFGACVIRGGGGDGASFRGLMSVAPDRRVEGRMCVRDFFLHDEEVTFDSGITAFLVLLKACLGEHSRQHGVDSYAVSMPRPLAMSIGAGMWGGGECAVEVDNGMMYKALKKQGTEEQLGTGSGDRLSPSEKIGLMEPGAANELARFRHLCWGADGY